MTTSVALSSGILIPESSVRSTVGAKARQAAASQSMTYGGNWTRIATAMGDPGRINANRLKDYESYLNAIGIPWVYQAGSTVAWSYAAAEVVVTQGTDRRSPQADTSTKAYKALLNLLNKPNPWMGGHELRERLAWHLQLTGNAFLVMDNLNGLDWPTELYLLRPSRVRIKPDASKYVSLFTYEVNGTMIPYEPEQIIWFKRTNPRDQYWGLGVIEAGEMTFNKQRSIARTEMAFFDAGARVKGVLTYDGILSDDQEQDLREQWRASDEGQSGEFKTAILQAGMDYKAISSDLLANGSGMETLAKMARDEILTLFGVPKQKVGIFEDANYRSIEADSFFQAETMTPMLRGTNDGWSALAQRFDPDYGFRHLEKVVTDYYDKAITAHYLAQSASFKRNEIRVMAGEEPLDDKDPLGPQVVGPVSMTIFDVNGPKQEMALPKPGTGADAPDDSATTADSSDAQVADPPTRKPQGTPAAFNIKPMVGAKSRCQCPSELVMAHKGMKAEQLGICTLHRDAVNQQLEIARKRSYSIEQTLGGYARESFLGVKAVIAAPLVVYEVA